MYTMVHGTLPYKSSHSHNRVCKCIDDVLEHEVFLRIFSCQIFLHRPYIHHAAINLAFHSVNCKNCRMYTSMSYMSV